MVVIKIETCLTHGDDPRMLRESLETQHILFAHILGVMRVHAHCGIEVGVLLRQCDGILVRRQISSPSDNDQRPYPCSFGARQDLFQIRSKLLCLNVTMSVDQFGRG